MNNSLVVGVTGRRHIVPDAIPAVELASKRIMRALACAAGFQRNVCLCTGLAVGADTIAAQALLDVREKDDLDNLRLRAVLPMPLSDYESDFDPSEREILYQILERADEVVELPTDDPLRRIDQYAKLRDYLVEETHALLAYWSGDASVVKPGGTVDVVLAKTKRFLQSASGAVVSVATPELLRLRDENGMKIYVPEKIPFRGACAVHLFGNNETALDAFQEFYRKQDAGSESIQ